MDGSKTIRVVFNKNQSQALEACKDTSNEPTHKTSNDGVWFEMGHDHLVQLHEVNLNKITLIISCF